MEPHIPPSRPERRICLLLHAYPPGYRADRGEEMPGTLLEATSDFRDWPSARDSNSLQTCSPASNRRTPSFIRRQCAPVNIWDGWLINWMN